MTEGIRPLSVEMGPMSDVESDTATFKICNLSFKNCNFHANLPKLKKKNCRIRNFLFDGLLEICLFKFFLLLLHIKI